MKNIKAVRHWLIMVCRTISTALISLKKQISFEDYGWIIIFMEPSFLYSTRKTKLSLLQEADGLNMTENILQKSFGHRFNRQFHLITNGIILPHIKLTSTLTPNGHSNGV